MSETSTDRDDPPTAPGASGPGEPGYEGEVTVGDDALEGDAAAEAVDAMDQRLGMEDPSPVIGTDPEPEGDGEGTASANPATTDGEAPSG
jgi:hypothetical protein